jgi:hypothetical protein
MLFKHPERLSESGDRFDDDLVDERVLLTSFCGKAQRGV